MVLKLITLEFSLFFSVNKDKIRQNILIFNIAVVIIELYYKDIGVCDNIGSYRMVFASVLLLYTVVDIVYNKGFNASKIIFLDC